MQDIKYKKNLKRVTYTKKNKTEGKKSNSVKEIDYSNFRRIISYFILAIIIVVFAIVIYTASSLFRLWNKVSVDNYSVDDQGNVIVSDVSSLPIINWQEKQERINILLLGLDKRTYESADYARTDTIMVLSIDPKDKTASMISIPRDLEVPYEKNGYISNIKINAVHNYGYDGENSYSGPVAVKKVVGDILGIDIHYFIRIDFDGFRELVDEFGGITINAENGLYDYQYPDEGYGYDSVEIDPGLQMMDGDTALKYARSRHALYGQGGDTNRAKRQQEVLIALKEKAIESKWAVISNPFKLQDLFSVIQDNYLMDISFEELSELAKLGKEINTSDSRSVISMVLADPYIVHIDKPGKDWRYYPADGTFDEIREYIADFLDDPMLSADIESEGAIIRVANGTSTPGIALNLSNELRTNYGITTQLPEDAENKDYVVTEIIDMSGGGFPRTTQYLEKKFGIKSYVPFEITAGETADIVIILGQDFVQNEQANRQ